uniref:Cyclic nucleotide-binding domain-containing protein n=1 Tax=Hanusia phi TaxID=3032 RepID=A0A7S0HTK3_9CRYP|mmetsp:Transcript_36483/g.82247  ORF Transcript_36483/g.82247 Transcript_36483/m.82247 type:complete len:200 (+) Transcript_36483:33-632(+)
MLWWSGSCCGSSRKLSHGTSKELSEMIHSEENIPANKDVLQEITPRQFDELDKAIEIAEIEQYLSRVTIFTTLMPKEISILARSLKPCTLRDGEYVYRQGDFADDFFLILGGSVQKVVESGDGEKPGIPVGNPLYHGQYFGQNALAMAGTKRSCSMKVVGKTELRSISRAVFISSFGPLSDILRRDKNLFDKFEAYFSK